MAISTLKFGNLIQFSGVLTFASSASAQAVIPASGNVESNQRLVVIESFGLITTAGATGTFVTLEDTGGNDIGYLGTATVDAQGSFLRGAPVSKHGGPGGSGDMSVSGFGAAGAGLQMLASATGPVIQLRGLAMVVPAP